MAPDGAGSSLPHVMSLKAASVEAEDCEVGKSLVVWNQKDIMG